jgi:hypothetical protein
MDKAERLENTIDLPLSKEHLLSWNPTKTSVAAPNSAVVGGISQLHGSFHQIVI